MDLLLLLSINVYLHDLLFICVIFMDSFYCIFSMKIGTTKIDHDLSGEKPVSKCHERGCFVQRVRYNVPMKQIAALASLSGHCEQHIRVSQCFLSFYFPILYIYELFYLFGAFFLTVKASEKHGNFKSRRIFASIETFLYCLRSSALCNIGCSQVC